MNTTPLLKSDGRSAVLNTSGLVVPLAKSAADNDCDEFEWALIDTNPCAANCIPSLASWRFQDPFN